MPCGSSPLTPGLLLPPLAPSRSGLLTPVARDRSILISTDTHLVSASSTLFLLASAYQRGLYFEPDAEIGMGCVLPFLGVLMSTVTTYGILEVGNTILDPFGDDAEDFALLHFVEYAMRASFEAIQAAPIGKRNADRGTFYSAEEIAAGTRIMKAIVKRNRWLKLVEAAMTHARSKRKTVTLAMESGPGSRPARIESPNLLPQQPQQQTTVAYKKVSSSSGANVVFSNGGAAELSGAQAMKIIDGDADGQMRPRVRKARRRHYGSSGEHPGRMRTATTDEPGSTTTSFASMSC